MKTTTGIYTKTELTQADIDWFCEWLYSMNIIRVA